MIIRGVYAAALSPRNSAGELDTSGLRKLLQFLLDSDICGFAMNGATGEFPATTLSEAEQIFELTAKTVEGRATFLAGIGASTAAQVRKLASLAARYGATAALLPMPYFYRYSQQDLEIFCRTVAAEAELPILLYNLPQFATGLEADTVLRLISTCENIVGIKDSSGSLDILERLTESAPRAVRIVGNDGVTATALASGVCDAVVSGVACVLPELLRKIHADPDSNEPQQALAEFIAQLDMLPTPWGLKLVAELRNIVPAVQALPIADKRAANMVAIREWFAANADRLYID